MDMMFQTPYMNSGWQCPICKRVYSPTTPMCFYCGNNTKTVLSTEPLSQPTNKLREIFFDESGKTARLIQKCHDELKKNKGCSTCKNTKKVNSYPGFVTGEENQCTKGLTCDTVLFTVTNCPSWEEAEMKGEE